MDEDDYDDSTSAQLRHRWLLWVQMSLTAVLIVMIVILAALEDVSVGGGFVLILFALLAASSIYGVTLKRR